jgi:hypothetical protein
MSLHTDKQFAFNIKKIADRVTEDKTKRNHQLKIKASESLLDTILEKIIDSAQQGQYHLDYISCDAIDCQYIAKRLTEDFGLDAQVKSTVVHIEWYNPKNNKLSKNPGKWPK